MAYSSALPRQKKESLWKPGARPSPRLTRTTTSDACESNCNSRHCLSDFFPAAATGGEQIIEKNRQLGLFRPTRSPHPTFIGLPVRSGYRLRRHRLKISQYSFSMTDPAVNSYLRRRAKNKNPPNIVNKAPEGSGIMALPSRRRT